MSSTPVPVTENSSPFVPTTTPTIERANRLISLRAHPGFRDALRIIQDLVQEASDKVAEYPGWDPQVIVILKVRLQEAKELHGAFLYKINEAIQDGVNEARIQTASVPAEAAKSADDAVDQGDYVRMQVLQQFEENDLRVAGSY